MPTDQPATNLSTTQRYALAHVLADPAVSALPVSAVCTTVLATCDALSHGELLRQPGFPPGHHRRRGHIERAVADTLRASVARDGGPMPLASVALITSLVMDALDDAGVL